MLSLLVAFGGLLGTGEINLSRIAEIVGISHSEALAEAIKSFESYAMIGIGTLLVIGLLPYLRPDKIIESGRRQKTSIERVTFWVASRALVIGIPLVVFSIIAREHITVQ